MREALANLLVGDFRALEDVTGDPRVDRVEVAGVDPPSFLRSWASSEARVVFIGLSPELT